MKKILMVATLLLMSFAQGKWIDVSLLMGNQGKDVLHGGIYQRNGLNFKTEVRDLSTDRVSVLSVIAYKFNGPLNQKELDLLSSEVFMYAVNCYNVSPDREKSLKDWIVTNKVNMRHTFSTQGPDTSTQIGPLNLNLTRWVNGSAYAVEVFIIRKGTPGSGAWKNYCLISG